LGLVYAAYFYQTYKWEAGLMVGYIGCRGEKTAMAVEETVKIMDTLRKEVPSGRLEQKRLDALNSFVFNVDTPAELVEVYSRYYMRNEPLDTLEKIQSAYLSAKAQELEHLARELLSARKLQVFVVADKTLPVNNQDGSAMTLEESLKILAQSLGLPYTEIPLR
jgi:predicted Zn-dependent peptidase